MTAKFVYRFDGKKYQDTMQRTAFKAGDIVSLGNGLVGHVNPNGKIRTMGGGSASPRFNATVASQILLGHEPPTTMAQEAALWPEV